MTEKAGAELWVGGVNTWECDEMGHMNVRFWIAKSIEALGGLAAAMGLPRMFRAGSPRTLRVREQHVRFLREARAGVGLYATGGIVEMGESDARLLLVMRHLSGEPAATFQIVVEHVDSDNGEPHSWPHQARDHAHPLHLEIPSYAAARSVSLAPFKTQATLERANHLGLKRIGLGLFGPEECDVFGRMRVEAFMGRISNGIPRLLERQRFRPAGARIGGAALEYRLVHLKWPRAGDALEMRSGVAGCDERFRRLVHWMLDPGSGRPWAVAEAIAAEFDLDARKIVPLPAETQAAIRAEAIPELTL